jgi:hypothetical protein
VDATALLLSGEMKRGCEVQLVYMLRSGKWEGQIESASDWVDTSAARARFSLVTGSARLKP